MFCFLVEQLMNKDLRKDLDEGLPCKAVISSQKIAQSGQTFLTSGADQMFFVPI